MRLVGYAAALVLGFVTGVAAIAVHRTFLGLLLGVGTALFVIWTFRMWSPRSGAAFAVGWLIPLLFGVAGRGEGDYVVASDVHGWLLIASGFLVLVAGLVWGRAPLPSDRSRSAGA